MNPEPLPPRLPLWPFLHRPELPDKIPAMTICIAAICENGKSIVLAADRIRWTPTASIEVELDEPKFRFLSKQLALMGSGASQSVEDVERRVRAMPVDIGKSIIETSAYFLNACHALRAHEIESRYSKRILGITHEEFRDAVKSSSPGSIIWDVYTKSLNFNLELCLILAGIDQEGAHLRTVDDSSDVSQSELGYASIGSGSVLADASLSRRGYRKSFALSEGLYCVYEAKKAAEMARGVGPTTDISAIRKGRRPLKLSPRVLESLASVYGRLKPKAMSKQDKSVITSALEKRE